MLEHSVANMKEDGRNDAGRFLQVIPYTVYRIATNVAVPHRVAFFCSWGRIRRNRLEGSAPAPSVGENRTNLKLFYIWYTMQW